MPTPQKRRFGDRIDGRRIRTLDPYHALSPYIMVKKNDANNSIRDSLEVTELDRFLRKLRAEHKMPGLGMLHFITASYLRVCAKYPELNRFVAGQRIYARYKPELVMSIKTEMNAEAPETTIKVPLEVTDTITEVYTKINEQLAAARSSAATHTDNTAAVLMKIPRLLLKFAIWVLNIVDYFGLLPQTLLDASPFHGSLIITDLGSIGLPAITHHLYNFGNMPVFISIGAKWKRTEMEKDGTVVERKYVDYHMVMDERITDGFYFSQIFRYFRYILKHPEELLSPPDEVVSDRP